MYKKILSSRSFWLKSVWMGLVYAAFIGVVQWASHNFSESFISEMNRPVWNLSLFTGCGIFIGILVNYIISWVQLKEK